MVECFFLHSLHCIISSLHHSEFEGVLLVSFSFFPSTSLPIHISIFFLSRLGRLPNYSEFLPMPKTWLFYLLFLSSFSLPQCTQRRRHFLSSYLSLSFSLSVPLLSLNDSRTASVFIFVSLSFIQSLPLFVSSCLSLPRSHDFHSLSLSSVTQYLLLSSQFFHRH